MSDTVVDDWSPADHPHAIAVSEAQWWKNTAVLAVSRMRSGGETAGWFDTRQIDARQLCIALRQLLMAEKLQQIALAQLTMNPVVSQDLARARERFEAALPGIKDMRDGLTHFEDWSRGVGLGPQRKRIKAGDTERDVARAFWSFAYDPAADTVSMGPYRIDVGAVDPAVAGLSHAIYLAAHQIDLTKAAHLRDTTLLVLTHAGIEGVQVSGGDDCRVLLSLTRDADLGDDERHELSARAVSAIASASLRLTSPTHPQDQALARRLADGELLLLHQP
ncbi:hypothetical protein ACFVZH_21210 [Streptomyces sp. NPDC059534]|uniref:hypothetical protein n=1 Tax=Streptomyces sp. NPDC059534 TaxID=3346859 RepID=UPI003681435D